MICFKSSREYKADLLPLDDSKNFISKDFVNETFTFFLKRWILNSAFSKFQEILKTN